MSPRMILVKGRIGPPVDENFIEYVAASPPDQITSFGGSGLPFANPEQAFDNTQIRGRIEINSDRTFELHLLEPNSFYEDLGNTFVGPSLYLRYKSGGKILSERVSVGTPIANRNLTYPEGRTSVEFYNVPPQGVRTQETIFNSSEYTVEQGPTFWGARPPV
jgi:hypothetical protein